MSVALVRIDLNTTIEKGRVLENSRFKAHADSIKVLRKKHAIVLLSHQGRKGDSDYLESLAGHARLLNKYVRVEYVDDLTSDAALNLIKGLKKGMVVLLKNVRSLDYETLEKTPSQHAKTELVKRLSSVCDLFVLDAFSVAHRSHASVVGFTKTLKSFPGPLFKNEVKYLSRIKKKKPVVLLGGAKLEEAFNLLEKLGAEKFLVGGLIGEVGLRAAGFKLGKKDRLINGADVSRFKKLLGKKVFLPIDFVLEDKSVVSVNDLPVNSDLMDVGPGTVRMFEDLLKGSRTVLVKGPLGVFEKGFDAGTLGLFNFVGRLKAVSVLGGGQSTTLKVKGFSHVCTAGGAMIDYLSGMKLPGLKALGFY